MYAFLYPWIDMAREEEQVGRKINLSE
jgi:hypothetical protein